MSFHDDNSWIWNDICWCADSDYCGIIECFRHLSHRKPQPAPDIFTLASFMDNLNCPYYSQEVETNDEL